MVFNTSVVIELSRANVLEKLVDYRSSTGLDVEFILPGEALEELRKGRGAEGFESLLRRIFTVLEAPKEIVKEISLMKPSLGPGELSVLAVASLLVRRETMSSVVAIVDDRRGRKAAEELGLERHGTLWIILQLKRHRVISGREAMEIAEELPRWGFHLDAETLEQAMRKIKADC
jgi:predicted nucleic acid-binding protein